MSEIKNVIFKENLAVILARWGYSQQSALRYFSDTTTGKMSSYCTGRVIPPINFLLKLEELTGVPIAELLKTRLRTTDIAEAPLRPGDKRPDVKYHRGQICMMS